MPLRMAKKYAKNEYLIMPSVDEDTCITDRNAKWYSHLENSLIDFL